MIRTSKLLCANARSFASVPEAAIKAALRAVDPLQRLDLTADSSTIPIFDPVHGDSLRPLGQSTFDEACSRFPHLHDIDPFKLIEPELISLSGNIKRMLGVDHPVLGRVAKYFFDVDGGKKMRPAVVLLMARASSSGHDIHHNQQRLAEITEMIHTASLLHDDVIDAADTRRGVSSVNAVFGNKLAILGGDFLLARASVALARLRDVEVVELLSTVIDHLVRGEVMQMRQAVRSSDSSSEVFEVYLRKTYYKTGSLIANSCRAAPMLSGSDSSQVQAAFDFGLNAGMAFQLVDDILDFEGTAKSLGKPALNDLKMGLATAPVLYASFKHPELLGLIERKFSQAGDVSKTCSLVEATEGLTSTRHLAAAYGARALDALSTMPDSEYRTALAAIMWKILNRAS